ncbi:MAG: uracil-DNA glycosylase family protein [Candidatus Magasanikbacteria bacterium]
MLISSLFEEYDKLQKIYGDKNLDAICGGGNFDHPKICFVFMNPTARNVASNKSWKGIKAPWIGTKQVWNMFYNLGLFSEDFIREINIRKPQDWDYEFSEKVYKQVSDNSIYITNLSKATQIDARALSNDVFKKYRELFKQEIHEIKPEIIVTFGNQVSSVLLEKNIKVSEYRKKSEIIEIYGNNYKIFPVYYPVGQGMRNIQIAREDIDWIFKTQIQ